MSSDLEIDVMRESASSVVTILKSLANTDRLLILCHLAQEELLRSTNPPFLNN
jgi:DNA-binding transcriptional ArsR family regulator